MRLSRDIFVRLDLVLCSPQSGVDLQIAVALPDMVCKNDQGSNSNKTMANFSNFLRG